jgi:hypothetical protein
MAIMSRKRWVTLLLLAAATLPSFASAQMWKVVCNLITPVWFTVTSVGPSLVVVMFVYGAVKYAYSADDPGGRKQGRDICIQAMIGGAIGILTYGILKAIAIAGAAAGSPFFCCWGVCGA